MQRTNIYLDEDQLRLLKHLAAEENKPVADFVRQAVDQFLRSRLENDVTWQRDMTALIERVRSRIGANKARRVALEGSLTGALMECFGPTA